MVHNNMHNIIAILHREMTKASDRYRLRIWSTFCWYANRCVFSHFFSPDSLLIQFKCIEMAKMKNTRRKLWFCLHHLCTFTADKVWNVNRRQIYLCIKCNFQLKRKTHGKFRILKISKKIRQIDRRSTVHCLA